MKNLFLQNFEIIIPLFFELGCCYWEFWCHSYSFSFFLSFVYYYTLFASSLGAFRIISLFLMFWSFTVICRDVSLILVIVLEMNMFQRLKQYRSGPLSYSFVGFFVISSAKNLLDFFLCPYYFSLIVYCFGNFHIPRVFLCNTFSFLRISYSYFVQAR